MKTLRILLVAVPSSGRDSLVKSLNASSYSFEISEATDKRKALLACSRFRFDVLVANHLLPDGTPEDLTEVLDGSMACLILREKRTSKDWVVMLGQTLDDWKCKVEGKTRLHLESQQLRHASALERCIRELKNISGGAVDQALKVILEVMEVSRVYIRETPIGQTGSPVVTHEIAAPGHLPILGSQRSAYEVSVQRTDGHVFHLGIEDVTYQRQWSPAETEFVHTAAHLLKDESGRKTGAPNRALSFRLSA
ncbi:hypothetical protein [Persicitalea sp.]|uniref:hypothetical protein n=1 Tax=Persicitalea sp. TaxID=3100273 RepID=UPI0035937ADA